MRKLFLCYCISMLFLGAGCASRTHKADEQRMAVTNPRVKIEDSAIQKWLRTDFVHTVQRADGLVEFEARFTNMSRYGKKLAYKVEWLDENGFVQKTLMSRWILSEVEGRKNLVIHGISPSAAVKDFFLILQRPNYYDNLKRDAYHKQHNN